MVEPDVAWTIGLAYFPARNECPAYVRYVSLADSHVEKWLYTHATDDMKRKFYASFYRYPQTAYEPFPARWNVCLSENPAYADDEFLIGGKMYGKQTYERVTIPLTRAKITEAFTRPTPAFWIPAEVEPLLAQITPTTLPISEEDYAV